MLCNICGSNKTSLKTETQDFAYSGKRFKIIKCNNCNAMQTYPFPEKTERYYDARNYASYNTKTSFLGVLYRLVQKINVKYKLSLLKKGGPKLLDYGAGSGFFVNYANTKGYDAFGYEPVNKTKNSRIYNKKTDFESKKYDIITLWHVLEHTKNPVRLLKDLKKILKTNGVVVVALPNTDSYDNLIYKKYWSGYDVPRHLYHFNRGSFGFLAKKVGYRIIKTKPLYFDSFYVSMLSEKYKKNPLWFVFGFFNGFLSNLLALYSKNHSSIIYIIK